LPIKLPAWGERLNTQNLKEALDYPVDIEELNQDQDDGPNREMQVQERQQRPLSPNHDCPISKDASTITLSARLIRLFNRLRRTDFCDRSCG
jgi:hypothetical protein